MTNIFTLKTTRTDEECVCVNFTCTEALTKKPQLKWTHSILRPVCACVLVAQLCLTVRCSGLELSRLLCPWSSPGKNTGVGSQSFFQRIFLTQGSNPGVQHCRQVLFHLSHQGRPTMTHQQHHLGTSSECRFLDCFPDLLNQKSWGPGLAICFKKPSW